MSADIPLLPYLPAARIRAFYEGAPGNEIESGKFASPESSSALAANGFGFFLDAPGQFPPLPGTEALGYPALSIALERVERFPWAGGKHPCLDAVIETADAVIGVESKRYEPFRGHGAPDLSDAYWRPVWGDRMSRYGAVRYLLRDAPHAFKHLDAAQLVKHAYGLRSGALRRTPPRQPVLYYLYAEPAAWADGRALTPDAHARHRAEVGRFAEMVAGDEVIFLSCTWADLVAGWRCHGPAAAHAEALAARFAL